MQWKRAAEENVPWKSAVEKRAACEGWTRDTYWYSLKDSTGPPRITKNVMMKVVTPSGGARGGTGGGGGEGGEFHPRRL